MPGSAQPVADAVSEERLEQLLVDAAEFFEVHLWESKSGETARAVLKQNGLSEKTIRSFGVGYAPVGPDELLGHLRERGYSTDELVAGGLATLSPRGRPHAHFRSRIVFPVKDRSGTILGFAGLGTHLGPSWALWVTSPDIGLYSRSQAVFGLDRASRKMASSGKAVVKSDCIEVLKAHQQGKTNAVTLHSHTVSEEQLEALATGVRGGRKALELDLPSGIDLEPKGAEIELVPTGQRSGASEPAPEPIRGLNLKRTAIVIAAALFATNAWTGAPLFAVWLGSQVQGGRVLSLRGVVTVLLTLAVLELLLLMALMWLTARYDELTGRPKTAALTSPWHRAKRGDRVQDIRARYGMSAPEKVVAISVVAGVLAFEIWFFFFAGSSLPS